MPKEYNVRLRQLIEDELGELRACASLPATEVEAMAERLARVVAAFVDTTPKEKVSRAA